MYELKYISHPRTGSRYISEGVFEGIPQESLKTGTRRVDLITLADELTRRSVDTSKETDHHALIITRIVPKRNSPDEQTIYDLIAGRMIEAFSKPCIKQVMSILAQSAGHTLSETKTKLKPLHREASLLACMETAGKDIEDEALRLIVRLWYRDSCYTSLHH